jgi:hypothetical protein
LSYLDPTTGALTVLDSSLYRVSNAKVPAIVTPAYNQTWPVVRCLEESIKLEYVAGYGAASAVPKNIKAGIKLLIDEMYNNRSNPDLNVANVILGPYRVRNYK